MTRSFLSVGQGAFYCECFEGGICDRAINIVYDCGSLTSIKIVEKAIKNNFQKGEIIDAVFISHLDEDHINGIPFLLKYCKVKKIYFPLITLRNRKIMTLSFLINDTRGFAFDFLNNPYQAIASLNLNYFPTLIEIEEIEQDREESTSDISKTRSGRNVFEEIIEGNHFNKGIYEDWLYIPFNFRQEERINSLLNNLTAEFGNSNIIDHIESIWKNNLPGDRDKIKNAYKNVSGNLNTNSMTLFSGILDFNRSQFIYKGLKCCPRCCKKLCYYNEKPSGCLYTGDYDANGNNKWDALVNAYKKYWKYIGCTQIPHHGSSSNFNNSFLGMNSYFIISAGYTNRYRHPHSNVIKAFLSHHIMPYIVTEQVGSATYFLIK